MWLTKEKLHRYNAITDLYKDLWFTLAERGNQTKFNYLFHRYFARKEIIVTYNNGAK